MRYSEIFKVSAEDLESLGVFNADVNVDSQLHIDPSLFRSCKILEFDGAYDEFNEYFAKVFTGLVPYARNNPKVFNQLVSRLSFHEIANTCLGYSQSGTHGNGVGKTRAKQIAETIIEIYDLGINNPVVFEMMPFFEEGIGPDRISDMAAYLLIRRLIKYTQRVCDELEIPMMPIVRLNGKPTKVPTYQHRSYVFVPSEVLCDLPTASSYDDIDNVCHYNELFRRRICQAIGEKWTDFKYAPKSRVKQFLFDNPEWFKGFIDEYEHTQHQPYNFVSDKKRVLGRCYTTTIRGTKPEKYVLVTFNHPEQAQTALPILLQRGIAKEVSIIETDGDRLNGRALKVVPIAATLVSDLEQTVNALFLNFFLSRTILPEKIVVAPAFDDIKKQIIEELNKAINTIYVCVAWFTDEEMRDVLLAKHQAGVDVRVITYHDGVNKKHGVDFHDIPHIERRGENGGIMHRKYCIIDNHVTIAGSFNWTDNATERNDENIEIIQDWNNANICTRQFLNDWNMV